MKLQDLKEKIPFHWRVQSFSKNKASCTCVAYVNARDVMDLLDKVVGAENWQDKYEVINGQMFCSIGIKIVSECDREHEWVWKSDTGTESMTEKEKGIVSDSFKRAAVKWGVGRFLYDLEIQYLNTNEAKNGSNYPYPIDNNGKKIYDITKHINNLSKVPTKQVEPTPTPVKAPKLTPFPTPSKLPEAIKEMESTLTLEECVSVWNGWNKQFKGKELEQFTKTKDKQKLKFK